MSSEVLLAITGLILTIILFFLDKLLNASTRSAKKYLIQKWIETKNKSLKLQTTIFNFASKYDGWNSMAFPEEKITYKDYYERLREVWEIEYSDLQYAALKKLKLSKYEINEYLDKLKSQEDAINLSQVSLNVMIKQYEK